MGVGVQDLRSRAETERLSRTKIIFTFRYLEMV